MKPPDFEYHRPERLAEVLTLLSTLGDATLLAGGQSLIPAMNFRERAPASLIDLNRVDELAGIRHEDGALVVGSMTRQRDVEISDLARARCPLVPEALAFVGHLPTRTRGTIGGSLAFADPLAELPTVALALGAELVIASGADSGRRTVPADDFVGRTAALGPTDLVTEVRFPTSGLGDGVAFEEAVVVRAAVSLHLDDQGVCRGARIALAGLAEGPVRASRAESMLRDAPTTGQDWLEIAETAVADLHPPDDPDSPAGFRRDLGRDLARGALHRAVDRARTSWER